MRIMGVDPSTKTGLAVMDFPSLEVVHRSKLTSKTLKGIPRAADLADQVLAKAQSYLPDMIVIEGYAHNKRFGQAVQMEIGAAIRLSLYRELLSWVDVAPSTMKKVVTGKGSGPKDLIMLELYKRFSVEERDNDIADAVGLAIVGGAIYDQVTLPVAHVSPALRELRKMHTCA